MARPPLWDSRLPLKDRSKTIRDNLWLEVYEEFGASPEFPIEFLIKKWRNLRDTYVRLKGEYTPSGSAGKKKKMWEYFQNLTFLNDTIAYKATVTNLSPLMSPNTEQDLSARQKQVEAPSPRQKQVEAPSTKMEGAILNALNRVNVPLIEAPVNPICIRISEMLNEMPQRPRALLEIKLLQVAFEGANEHF